MKTSFSSNQRGGAFITVVVFCFVLMLLIASILRYSTLERRLNNRAKLLLESRTAAEAISEYGMAQVTTILNANRTFTDSTWSTTDESLFVPGGARSGVITMPPDSGTTNFWGGSHIVTSAGAAAEQPKLHIGKILQVSDPVSGSALYYIDPNIPANATDPLKGKRVFRYDLDVLSRATAADASGGGSNVTKYMQQTYSVRAVPLFTNAVYYNMDMEVQPGPNLDITGSTHTNGRLFVRSASASPTYISFAGPVTAVKGIWTNFHTNSPSTDNIMPYFQSITDSGSTQTNATTGIIKILKGGTTTFSEMCLTAGTSGFSPALTSGTWVESTWDLHPTGETWQQHLATGSTSPKTETSTTLKNFKDWCQQTFAGNLMTHADGLTPNTIPGIPDYSYVYGSLYPDPSTGTADAAYTYMTGTGNDLPNAAHALIETPRLNSAASYLLASENIKYSRTCSLYIVANTGAATATGHMPDGTTINVGGKSYRAFMNNTTTSPATISEVILPGQNTFGDSNGTANPYLLHKNARPVIQMMNIDFATNLEQPTQRRMVDMRRTGSFDQTQVRSAANPYDPKNLFMIDLDMTELKKAIRTINVATSTIVATTDNAFYQTGLPVTYANYIYNLAATPTNTVLDDTTRIITTDVTTLTSAFTAAIWNGAVYIESIAADAFDATGGGAAARTATHLLRNSGVRVINGRGKVPSLDGVTGFTLATNDAVYVLGTFNADGDAATPATVSVNVPSAPGASTGHNYEPNELPASIVGDAIYLLSQPSYSSLTVQTAGWNDAFSGMTEGASSGNWSASWATTAPSGTNTHDGIFKTASSGTPDGVYPYKVPYDSASGNGSTGGTTLKPDGSNNQKFAASFTEYSFAMLCGLVPTGKNGITQTSGGLHNFPRFLESWGGVDCRIRGAMVALFECRVANDTWNLRTYAPPHRVWGFNLLFDQGIMPPLTPKTIELKRSYENDITKSAYNAKLTTWGYPTLP